MSRQSERSASGQEFGGYVTEVLCSLGDRQGILYQPNPVRQRGTNEFAPRLRFGLG